MHTTFLSVSNQAAARELFTLLAILYINSYVFLMYVMVVSFYDHNKKYTHGCTPYSYIPVIYYSYRIIEKHALLL